MSKIVLRIIKPQQLDFSPEIKEKKSAKNQHVTIKSNFN